MQDDELQPGARALHAEGYDTWTIARKLGISQQRVVKLIAEREAPCETCVKCGGCGALIHFNRVRPGEDDTLPWRATLPSGHSRQQSVPELLYFYCPASGDGLAVEPPGSVRRPEPQDDEVEIETWGGQKLKRSKPVQIVKRIGHIERDRAVERLTKHYGLGHLELDEFEERSAKAAAARTQADLEPLFADLPDLEKPKPAPEPDRPHQVVIERRYGFCNGERVSFALVAMAAAWAAFTQWTPAIGFLVGFLCLFLLAHLATAEIRSR